MIQTPNGSMIGILSTNVVVSYDGWQITPPTHISGSETYKVDHCIISSFNESEIHWSRIYSSTNTSSNTRQYDLSCDGVFSMIMVSESLA